MKVSIANESVVFRNINLGSLFMLTDGTIMRKISPMSFCDRDFVYNAVCIDKYGFLQFEDTEVVIPAIIEEIIMRQT